MVLTHANRLDEADQVFAAAVEQYPQNARIHYFRGKLLLQLASSKPDADAIRDNAMQEFMQATRYDATHADSWYQLASLIRRASRIKRNLHSALFETRPASCTCTIRSRTPVHPNGQES